MSEAAFPAAIAKVLQFEGGYVDDPDDPGGETNFGISKRAYPDVDIANLTIDDATAIYHRDYWLKPGYDTLPDAIGGKMLDIGVNMGPGSANRVLQRACNHRFAALGYQTQLAIDGILGPASRAAIDSINGTNADAFLAALRTEDANHYREIAAAHPVMQKYLRGWLQRAAS